jgi:DNA invertase Pin-like site-specific DNA recombinase/transposase
VRAAIYARVSTERQERQQTIDSQLAALRTWAEAEGHDLNDRHVFRDEGCSGSRLDALRDAVRDDEVEILGVLAPDRLARKYAYQVLLLEEFRRAGCAVAFLGRAISDDPGDQLLLQIQGAVAEYERALLSERFRRGKLQKARAGQFIGVHPLIPTARTGDVSCVAGAMWSLRRSLTGKVRPREAMMTVAVTRLELGADELRRAAVRCRDVAARRMLALALVLEGHSRAAAARAGGMDRQTLCDWVHRYNEEGLAGLYDRHRSGRRPRLTPEQMAELAAVVERGPDPERDGVVRWRRVDLQALIKDRFEVELHQRSVGKLLHRLGFVRLSVRPRHPSSDPQAQEVFKKASLSW